jgi:hypothetical protein
MFNLFGNMFGKKPEITGVSQASIEVQTTYGMWQQTSVVPNTPYAVRYGMESAKSMNSYLGNNVRVRAVDMNTGQIIDIL